jgi:dipeptidyl-peptidase-4
VLDDRAIAEFPRIGTAVARQVKPSFDGRYLAFLWSERGDDRLALWAADLTERRTWKVLSHEVGYESLDDIPLDVELVRERRRHLFLGILDFWWLPKTHVLAVTRGGDLSTVGVQPSIVGVTRLQFSVGEAILTPKSSPDGTKVAFAAANDLWVCDVSADGDAPAPGAARRITDGGSAALLNGTADFLAQEELGRLDAFWWHPGGEWIAFVQTDLSDVPRAAVPARGSAGADPHPYAFSGAPIGRWKIGLARADGGEVRWLPVRGEMRESYLARAQFDGRGRFAIHVLSRDQKRLSVFAIETESDAGEWQVLLGEESPQWIDLAGELSFVGGDETFLRLSSAGDENRIELRARDGALLRTIDTGEVRVDSLVGVAPGEKDLWFHGRGAAPEERGVYRIALDGAGPPVAVSDEPGWHDARFLTKEGLWLHTHESVEMPPAVRVRDQLGNEVFALPADPRPCAEVKLLPRPEFIDVPAEGGLPLRACVYRPAAPPPPSGHPLAIAVYGGPRAQTVRNAWDVRVDLRAQRLVENGFVVLKTDGRGSAGRGNAFERQIEGAFGTVEVDDQVAGVAHVVKLGLADRDRVAVFGWSYGGYLAAMCLFRRPDVFRAAVAGAPVVTWEDYDACYTERYMGTPQASGAAYERASLLSYVPKLAGRLLLMHGVRDENVLLVHTLKLISALNAAAKPYDLLLLPEERHSVRRFANRELVERRLFQHVAALQRAPLDSD